MRYIHIDQENNIDITSDVSKVDELSMIMRYIHIDQER